MSNSKDYCGIVFIGSSGASWEYASTPEEAAKRAAKRTKTDWKSLFEFKPKHELKVVLLDMKNHDGWYADHRGIFDSDTHKMIEPIGVKSVVV